MNLGTGDYVKFVSEELGEVVGTITGHIAWHRFFITIQPMVCKEDLCLRKYHCMRHVDELEKITEEEYILGCI